MPQHLDLPEDETAALVALLTCTIEERPISLRASHSHPEGDLAKLRPEPAHEPLPPPKIYALPRATAAMRRR
jgi:hypothetical protein